MSGEIKTVLFPFLLQKIRTVELDGKTIKLQIVSGVLYISVYFSEFFLSAF